MQMKYDFKETFMNATTMAGVKIVKGCKIRLITVRTLWQTDDWRQYLHPL